MEIPSETVGKYETVDPATEELLFDGFDLRNGMIVIIDDVELRWELEEDPDDRTAYYIAVMNRWCRISNVLTRGGKVEFIATYEDGFMLKRSTPVDKAWIVKKETIPPRSPEEWKAQNPDSWDPDPETSMKLSGHAPNPSTIVDFDSGETREV